MVDEKLEDVTNSLKDKFFNQLFYQFKFET